MLDVPSCDVPTTHGIKESCVFLVNVKTEAVVSVDARGLTLSI